MVEIKKTGRNHDTCPRCGGKDTTWGSDSPSPDNSSAHFHMECEACGAHYVSVFEPVYQIYYGDE